ncbi:MAG: hypothetical protein CM15mP83_8640 [Flavobacteriaceae bacterium]|nr:MAG: hypothetical protein CM15mP83_8640 [Flavobacteriaceae bacterium]
MMCKNPAIGRTVIFDCPKQREPYASIVSIFDQIDLFFAQA